MLGFDLALVWETALVTQAAAGSTEHETGRGLKRLYLYIIYNYLPRSFPTNSLVGKLKVFCGKSVVD